MTKTEKENLKEKLNKYSKDEIIGAVVETISEFDVHQLKHRLFSIKTDRLLKKFKEASKEETHAFDEYIRFYNDLAEKYGDGKKIDFGKATQEEHAKLTLLYVRFQNKQRVYLQANRALDKCYEENEK